MKFEPDWSRLTAPFMAGDRFPIRHLAELDANGHPKRRLGSKAAIRIAIPFRNSVRTKWNWTSCPSPVNAYRQTLYSMHPHRHGAVMPTTEPTQALRSEQPDPLLVTDISTRKPPQRASSHAQLTADPLLTVDDVARRLNVSKDWVWDHSSRKAPRLPVIRMGDGTLRYRASGIEDFISERERLSSLRSGRR